MKHYSAPAALVTKTLLVGTIISFCAVTVFAKPPFNPHENPTTAPTVTNAPSSTPRPSRPPVSFSTAKLSPGLVQACQAHERVIKTRTEHLVQLATDMLVTFDRISTGVQAFYKDHVLATGASVPNYDQLLSDIQVKQAQVQTDLTTTKNDAAAFACTGIDPKGHLTQFRIDMQEVKTSLKEYRTAIKNLIVAVHTAGAKETLTPTKAP